MLEQRDVIVVASFSAIYGLGNPHLYLKMMLHLTSGVVYGSARNSAPTGGAAIRS
ncbi:hypothetical protein ACNKHU_04430 [Shigella flexneri]